MKLVQSMKLAKELLVKADDLRKKIAANSAILSIERAAYKEQTKQIQAWLQAHADIMQEIGRLRVCIARTNLMTVVTMNIGGKNVDKTITEWIVRRATTSPLDVAAWHGIRLKPSRFKDARFNSLSPHDSRWQVSNLMS